MSTKKVQHAAEEIAGQAKESVGKVTGDRSLEGEGAQEKDEARLKKAGDSVKDAVGDVKRAVKD